MLSQDDMGSGNWKVGPSRIVLNLPVEDLLIDNDLKQRLAEVDTAHFGKGGSEVTPGVLVLARSPTQIDPGETVHNCQ